MHGFDLEARGEATQFDAVMAQAIVLDLVQMTVAVEGPAVLCGPSDEFFPCHSPFIHRSTSTERQAQFDSWNWRHFKQMRARMI